MRFFQRRFIKQKPREGVFVFIYFFKVLRSTVFEMHLTQTTCKSLDLMYLLPQLAQTKISDLFGLSTHLPFC